MSQEKLLELQSLDLAIDDALCQSEDQRRRVVNFQESAALRRRERDLFRDKHKVNQVECRQVELSIEVARTRTKGLEQKVLRVINARELEALNKEIEALKVKIDALEESLLSLYETSEKLEAEIKRREADLKKRDEQLVKLDAEVASRLSDLDALAARLRGARDETIPLLDGGILSRYSASRGRHGGQVVFEIRENSCGGCGLSAPTFEWGRIRQNPGNVYGCSNCGRLLIYVGEVS